MNNSRPKAQVRQDALVEAFFLEAIARDPERVAKVFAQFPVKTERQLEYRRSNEVSAFSPSDEAGGDFDNEESHQGVVVSGLAAIQEAERRRRP